MNSTITIVVFFSSGLKKSLRDGTRASRAHLDILFFEKGKHNNTQNRVPGKNDNHAIYLHPGTKGGKR